MAKIASFLWLALFVSFLGWYGWAMVGIGVALYVIGFFVKCWWDDRQSEKHQKERGL